MDTVRSVRPRQGLGNWQYLLESDKTAGKSCSLCFGDFIPRLATAPAVKSSSFSKFQGEILQTFRLERIV